MKGDPVARIGGSSVSRPQGNFTLRNHSCPPRFSDCPWGCPQTCGPALDSTEATPTCFSLRVPTPTPSATGCVGLCFPRRPHRIGDPRSALACGRPPTLSAPGAWPQPPRRSSFSSSHPTCKYYRTPFLLRGGCLPCSPCRSPAPARPQQRAAWTGAFAEAPPPWPSSRCLRFVGAPRHKLSAPAT